LALEERFKEEQEELAVLSEDTIGEEFLLALGYERGYVTYEDIQRVLPEAEENVDRLDDILEMLIESGITIGGEDSQENDTVQTSSKDSSETEEDEKAEEDIYRAIEVDDTIGLYLKEIGKVALLTAQEEVSLAKRMEAGKKAQARLGGGKYSSEDKRYELETCLDDGIQAREHLIRANSRLVISVAKKYIGRGVPFLDLIQE